MKKTFSSKKSAFSLIELSIVLIVIGLLIAGITGGASLIKSSELRSVMSEARSYAVGVNAFYTQFNALPGDYGTAIGSSTTGNNNSQIEYYGTGPVSESSNAWTMLRTIGAVDNISSASPVVATTSPIFGTTSTATAPASKIKSSGWAFDFRSIAAAPFDNESASQNVVVLSGSIGTGVTAGTDTLVNGANVATAALLSSDVLSIDAKLDDGLPGSGKIKGLNIGTATFQTAAATASAVVCYYGTANTLSSYVYNTTNTTKSCALSYQIDVNS